jgi:hypothetical protein
MSIIEKFGFGPAAERARFNFKLKKKIKRSRKLQASSHKLQAASAMKQTQLKNRIKI